MQYEEIDTEEEMVTCNWCDNEFAATELLIEQDMGCLCNQCIRGIESRGTKLILRRIK